MTGQESFQDSDNSVERAWVERAQRGDPEAVGWLYDRYSQRVYAYACAKLGDRVEAEDITAQVFLKMLEKLADFRWQGAGFAAWLFRIAYNLIADTFRHRASHAQIPLDDAGTWLVAEDSYGADPSSQAERAEFAGQLRAALPQLSDLQAQVIILRYWAGLSNPEIAETLARSTNAVNSLHYEALKKLERIMAQKGYTNRA